MTDSEMVILTLVIILMVFLSPVIFAGVRLSVEGWRDFFKWLGEGEK